MFVKQMLFLVAMMVFCGLRSLVDPFWGIFLYYTFSVLRPQAVWEWSLPEGIRWSLFTAIIAVVAVVAVRLASA